MTESSAEQEIVYRVVVNYEEQYSIWPGDRALPPGWRDAGKSGSKADCLAYIERVWTDMRPLSLRLKMEAQASAPAEPTPPQSADPRDDLVAFLSAGDHPVEAAARSAEHLLERIEAGHVNIRFTDTRGGTELGMKLDPSATRRGEGSIHLAGDLTLDYRRVRLIVDISLDTLKGLGRLQPVR
jgi:uncharacterized protein YbdZ (MbtH family)